MNTRWDIRCEICGKFCRPYDRGNYYGSVLDLEPPDVVYFCKPCVEKELRSPEKIISGCWWIKPNYVEKICNDKQTTH